MARLIVLDSGPLGLACSHRADPKVVAIRGWLVRVELLGARVIVPEIADYEVRRELIRLSARSSLKRLDSLCHDLIDLPITTAAMRRAADLWASARASGQPTASLVAIDADVILAAQALEYSGLGDRLTVATVNVKHLTRYLDAVRWEDIAP